MLPKIRPALALTIALSLFNGCWWDTSSSASAPTISGLAVTPNQVAKTGDASKITGTLGIETDNATVSYKVTNASGDVTGKFTIGSIPGSISGSSTLAGTILATSADDGSYTLAITVTDADGQVTSQTAGFTVGTPAPEFASKGTVTLGSQSSSKPSFLQLTNLGPDNKAVAWGSGDGKPVESIYIVFGKDGSSNLSLMSPDHAAGDGFPAVDNWTLTNNALIVDLGGTMPATKTSVVSALASVTTEKAAATSGHYYGVKLPSGVAVLLINSITGQDASVSVWE